MKTEASPHLIVRPEMLGTKLKEKARAIAPHIGNVSLAKRIMRPESYRQAIAEVRDAPKWHKIHSHLRQYAERNQDFFFVQIGANDGVGHDPVRSHILEQKWRGLLVEPVPHVFHKLKRNYANHDQLDFANVAVSERNGSAIMMAAVELPDDAKNPLSPMSSFHPEIVRKHEWITDTLEGMVEAVEVPTQTLPTLLESYGVQKIDGLFVDTEGHDKVVLDQLDFEAFTPQFVLYEHGHLCKAEQQELVGRFELQGYEMTTLRRDTFAELIS